MQGGPGHFELGVPDARRAKEFYGPLLGWEFHRTGAGEESWIDTGGVRGGLHENDPDADIRVYFSVSDIDAALRKVAELGGMPGKAGPPDPGFGRFAECQDNQGVRFGLHEAG